MKMIKPTKTILSAMTICIVIAFASVADTSDNDITFDAPKEHQGNKHDMKFMAKALSLSEQQQVQIKAIKKQVNKQSQSLRVSMKQFKMAEKKLLQSKIFDEQAYSTLNKEYQSTFAQIGLIKAKNKHAVFNILTTEQQLKWLKIMKRHQRQTNKFGG